ncbi:MAG: hypothetical protein KI788_17010 [Mameliella sp.]|nr:hypothetical protein [Mameliella sp.]
MTKNTSVTGNRKNNSATFKTKVALKAILGEMTVAELQMYPGEHQILINTWKRQALAGLSGTFSGNAETKAAEQPHTQIGWLAVNRDFLVKSSGKKASM